MAKPTGVYLIHGDLWSTEKPIGPFASIDAAIEFDNDLEREEVGIIINFTDGVISPAEYSRTLEEELRAALREAPYPFGVPRQAG